MIRISEEFALAGVGLSEAATSRVTEALLPAGGGSVLEVTIPVIHEGLTRNNTFYRKEYLTHTEKNDQGQPGGLESWTQPYEAPMIKDHEASTDNIIGRAKKAVWGEKQGRVPGHQEVTFHVTDPVAIEKFLRGEYQTGSIGMDTDWAKCSICGEDLKDSPFGGAFHAHERGKWYGKPPKDQKEEGGPDFIEMPARATGSKRAMVEIGPVWAREYSVVAVPSDARSKVASMKRIELTEAVLRTATESVDLLDTEVRESFEADPQITPPGKKPEEQGEKKTSRYSVAELCSGYRYELEDPLSLYFDLLSMEELYKVGLLEEKDGKVHLTDSGHEGVIGDYIFEPIDMQDLEKSRGILPQQEVISLAEYIYANNEDLEEELEEIKEAVLSSTARAELPDSAFALVKTFAGKKLRALPYKKEDGTIDRAHLRTALTRWSQPKGFTKQERVRALAKLRRAAAKVGLGKHSSSEAETKQDVQEAQDLLLAQLEAGTIKKEAFLATFSIETPTGSEQEHLQEHLQEQLEATDLLLTEANTLLAEREEEGDRLVEQLTQAKAALKNQVVDQILALENLQEDALLARREELLKKEPEALKGVLEQSISDNREIIITGRATSTGLSIGDDDSSRENAQVLDRETLLMAQFGSPRAQREVIGRLRNGSR